MNRLLLRLMIALFTFGIGITLTIMCERYNARVREEQAARRIESERIVRAPIITQGLSAKLQRIDEIYRERCRVLDDELDRPDTDKHCRDAKESWAAIIELHRLDSCNDEWAKARREAISAERVRYLVIY